jgi:endoglucanase
MVRSLIALLFAGLSFASFAQASWNNNSFVHRSGRQIVDNAGTPIRLSGVNLGGWLMWEGWIWGGGYTAEKTIYNCLASKAGGPAAARFRDSVHRNYITRADIEKISEQCFNVVRVPFNHNILEDDADPFVYKQSGWNLLDSLLDWCEDNDVYAVLDLHGAAGGQSSFFIADPDLPNMWGSQQNLERTASLWKAVADRYKDRGIIAGYDLLNEPNAPNDSSLLAFYEVLIDSVRSVDNNHMLFIEGKTSSTDFSPFTSPPDGNMLFTFHFYTWFVWNIPNALDEFVQLSEDFNVPVWCGEWGENNYDQLQETMDNFRLPANQIGGEAFWTWKKLAGGSSYPGYAEADSTALWNKTIKWAGNIFAPQPTAAEAQQGMNEFVQNIRLWQCSFNDTINDILIACEDAGMREADTDALMLYPNPASGKVLVAFPGGSAGEITVTDAMGRIVRRFRANIEDPVINLDGLEEGVYSVTFSGGTIIGTARLILKF